MLACASVSSLIFVLRRQGRWMICGIGLACVHGQMRYVCRLLFSNGCLNKWLRVEWSLRSATATLSISMSLARLGLEDTRSETI
jgi:hypothetical protein